MKRRSAPAKGASTNIHFDHKWSGRGAHIDIDLYNRNRLYRGLVRRRWLWEQERDDDLRGIPDRDLLRQLWAQGGEERIAALEQLHLRWYGRKAGAA